jgi:hypothetical protein
MSNNFKKILYLGAWEHIEIVDYFPNCNEFILIDTMPRSEHDEKDYFYDGFYRRTFLDKLITKCINKGFIHINTIELDPTYMNIDLPYINPHLFIFRNENRIIKYYISTNILFNMNKLLEDDIKTSDTLYVAGYFPNEELLKYFSKKMIFAGDDDTVYFSEPDPTDNNIISSGLLKEYFDKYYLICRETGKIILCDSLEDIDNKINK